MHINYTSHIKANDNKLIMRAKKLSGLKSKREILRQALQFYVRYLEKQDIKAEKSFYELTKHLAGTLEGPDDLAHNPK